MDQDPSNLSSNKQSNEYYLEVVRVGEKPEWPKDEADLSIGSQSLGSGYIQYWAYPKSSALDSGRLPDAEKIAAKNPTDRPAVLIDQPGDELELILVKDGHAWVKDTTSIENMEDSITSILDLGRNKFNIVVEHFMTTDRVSDDVEEKLNKLESEEGGEKEVEQNVAEDMQPEDDTDAPLGFRPVGNNKPAPQRTYSVDNGGSDGTSKVWFALPILTLVVVAVAVILFRHQILSKITGKGGADQATPSITLTPTVTPSPTPSIDRGKYQLRVLNGTLKSGAAGTLADTLKALGWGILKTGNATDSDVAQTMVRVKADKKDILSVLVADLGKDYDASGSADLPTSDKADAEIVIGAK